MGKVISKLFDEPFSLNHAAIISIVVHAIFLSTQPFSFLNKPTVLEKKYKEVSLEFIKRTSLTPVVKKVMEVKKPFLRKINTPILPKPIHLPIANPVKQISSQPLSVRPTMVSTVSRASQIVLASVPIMQSFHSKSMPAHLNIPRKSKKASEIVISSKIVIAKKFKVLGSRTNYSKEQFKPGIEMRRLESLDTKGISVSMMMNKGGIKRSFKPQARNVPMLAPDQQEDPLTADEQKNLWAGYTSAVRKMIANAKVYPPKARDKGQQGKIDLSFKLGKHGELLKLLIENSSGNNILDDAARNAVENAGPFPPIPEKLNKQYVLLELPISFVLR
tara:strand:+ start:224 stop:1219 length:996 start_codon:yes stop_codon:yes gene_type:complete